MSLGDSAPPLSREKSTGPDRPTYPHVCGSPLSQATVWGLNEGWAKEIPELHFRTGGLPDGAYSLTLRIAPTYVRQLAIPPRQAVVSVRVDVKAHTGARYGMSPGHSEEGTSEETQGVYGSAGGMPNMRALPSHHVDVEHKRNGHDYLNFAATVWNAGPGPLVVEGFRNRTVERMPATQFIYRHGRAARHKQVGTFEFDKRHGHNHWHMEDMARYDLLNDAGRRLLLSTKQSFCMAPTDPIDLTVSGADWQADSESLTSACAGEDAIWQREFLPAGWGDTYYQSVAGQSFDITELPNGKYTVRITADPRHHLIEESYGDNTGLLPISLGGKPGHRTVTVRE